MNEPPWVTVYAICDECKLSAEVCVRDSGAVRWCAQALYEAANVLLARITRFSKLKRWAMDVAKRRGSKRAKVALARKIAVILHRMWVDGSTYRWTETQPIAAQA